MVYGSDILGFREAIISVLIQTLKQDGRLEAEKRQVLAHRFSVSPDLS